MPESEPIPFGFRREALTDDLSERAAFEWMFPCKIIIGCPNHGPSAFFSMPSGVRKALLLSQRTRSSWRYSR